MALSPRETVILRSNKLTPAERREVTRIETIVDSVLRNDRIYLPATAGIHDEVHSGKRSLRIYIRCAMSDKDKWTTTVRNELKKLYLLAGWEQASLCDNHDGYDFMWLQCSERLTSVIND